MRPQPEQDWIRRDPAIPGLGLLMDLPALLDVISDEAGLARLDGQGPDYIRYKPGRNCLASYRITSGGREWRIHAKAHAWDAPEKLRKASARPAGSGPWGPGRVILCRHALEISAFPQDNKLPALPKFADDAWRSTFLGTRDPDWSADPSAGCRTLAYKPERRWVADVRVNATVRGVLRLHSQASFDSIRPAGTPPHSGEALRVAPPRVLSRSRCAVWTDWMEGESFTGEWLRSSPLDAWRSLGYALAEFHSQTPASVPRRETPHPLSRLAELNRFLKFILPGSASLLGSVAERLQQCLPPSEAAPVRLHGDFAPSQVLRGPRGTVAFLDLDESRPGEAAEDLGSFLSSLDVAVVRGTLALHRVEAIHEALIEGYHGRLPEFPAHALPFHRCLGLYARLPEFFRGGEPDWADQTRRTLESLAVQLDRLPTTHASRPVTGWDPELPGLAAALDPHWMQPRLSSVLAPSGSGGVPSRLDSVHLRRHKPGRRALIEYRFSSPGTEPRRILGKLQRRGVDDTQLQCLRMLHQGGLSPSSAEGVSVPPVLGTVVGPDLWLQEFIPAIPLSERLDAPAGAMNVRRAADALVHLHRQRVPILRHHGAEQELEILEKRLVAMSHADRGWNDRVAAVLQGCRERVARTPSSAPVLLHRDFYPDQVLLGEDRVWLVDLDLLCAGDPAIDAGNFIGHLLELGLRRPDHHEHFNQLGCEFRNRYLELAPEVDRRGIDTFTTLTLARHIAISRQFPDRHHTTAALIRLCECRLEEEPMPS